MNVIHGLLGAGSVAISNNDLYRTSLDLLNGKLLSEQNKDIIYAPGNNALHYRGGMIVFVVMKMRLILDSNKLNRKGTSDD